MYKTLLTAATLAVVALTVLGDECARHSDGCSVPFGLTLRYQRTFRPSCYRHDVCYGCGAVNSLSRTRCDLIFLENMQAACRPLPRKERNECRSMAYSFYFGVRLFGKSSYHEANNVDAYCPEAWVQSCLS